MRYGPAWILLFTLLIVSCKHPQSLDPETDSLGTFSLKAAFSKTLFSLDSTLLTLQISDDTDEKLLQSK